MYGGAIAFADKGELEQEFAKQNDLAIRRMTNSFKGEILGAMSAIQRPMARWLSTEKNDWPTIFNVSCV